MADLFELPPDRQLPADVHARLQDRVLPGVHRSGARRRFAPVTAAVAAVVAVVAVLLASLLVRPAGPPPAGGGVDLPPVGQSGLVTPTQLWNGRVGSAPADTTARCLAVARRPGGPGPTDGRWQALLSGTAPGVVVAAYGFGDRRLFCETTPTTVTLSAPVVAAAGPPARITFFSPLGTAAGLTAADVDTVDLTGDGDGTDVPVGAMVGNGVFLLPNLFRAGTPSLVLSATSGPTPYGPLRVPMTTALAPVVHVTDIKPKAVGHQPGALTRCLQDRGSAAVPDPGSWTPGAETTLPGEGVLTLARYGQLLLVCRPPIMAGSLRRLVGDGRFYGSAPRPAGSHLIAAMAGVFYNFRPMPGTPVGTGSDTIALAGVLTTADATAVVVRRHGLPDLTARVTNRTFVIPRIGLNDVRDGGPGDRGDFLVLGRSGKTLETIRGVQF